MNGTLYFAANEGGNGWRLWRSDSGASGGTNYVATSPRLGQSGLSDVQLENVNGTLYFIANDGTHGYELWKTDGTSSGTVLVKDINPGAGSSSLGLLTGSSTNVNGTLYFAATDGTHGDELWKSDGSSSGTVLVADAQPGLGGTYPQYLTNVNGTLFYTASHLAEGRELWKSSGTSSGHGPRPRHRVGRCRVGSHGPDSCRK